MVALAASILGAVADTGADHRPSGRDPRELEIGDHVNLDELRAQLVAVVGHENVLNDPARLRPYGRQVGPYPIASPQIVVRPGTVDEVSRLTALVDHTPYGIVPYGNGLALTGRPAMDRPEVMVLDLSRLNAVRDIDEQNMTVTAEAGVLMAELERQVAARGFQVHTVAVPTEAATLGGVLSGVMGGGLPRDAASVGGLFASLMGLTVVLADGTQVALDGSGPSRPRKTPTIQDGDGPYLLPMFVGDGGSLGIKVQATLSLEPLAGVVTEQSWTLPSLASAYTAMARLTALREQPYAALTIEEISEADGDTAAWRFSCVVRASDRALLDQQLRQIEGVLAASGAHRSATGSEPTDAQSFERTEAERRQRYLSMPRATLAFIFGRGEFLAGYSRIREELTARIHDGDGAVRALRLFTNFSPHTRHAVFASIGILYDPSSKAEQHAAVELARRGYRLVAELGGYSEPHQGEAARSIASGWSQEYRRLVKSVKHALDPNGTLNPGLWWSE